MVRGRDKRSQGEEGSAGEGEEVERPLAVVVDPELEAREAEREWRGGSSV